MPHTHQKAKFQATITKALDDALDLFSHQGFRASTMRDIAHKAGLSMGSLYHHFPNKDAIFERLFERYWERLLDPELELNQVFARANFPDDLEEMVATKSTASISPTRPWGYSIRSLRDKDHPHATIFVPSGT